MTLSDAYTVEQAILMAGAVSFLMLFSSQWAGESASSTKYSRQNVKFTLHRLGVLIAALQVALFVDPYGVRGWYVDPIVQPWIMSNITALLVTAVLALNQTAIEVVYVSGMRSVPKWNSALSRTGAVLLLLSANATHAVAYYKNRWWFTSFNLFLLALVESVAIVSFVLCTAKILGRLNKAESNAQQRSVGGIQRTKSKRDLANDHKKLMMKLRAAGLVILALVAVPMQLVAAVSRVRNRSAEPAPPDTDQFSLRDRGFIYGQLVGTLLVLWYSWVPPPKARGYEPVSTSRSNSTSRTRYRDNSSSLSQSVGWKEQTRQRIASASARESEAERAALEDPFGDIDVIDSTNDDM